MQGLRGLEIKYGFGSEELRKGFCQVLFLAYVVGSSILSQILSPKQPLKILVIIRAASRRWRLSSSRLRPKGSICWVLPAPCRITRV